MIKVTGFTFTPIHTFVPRKQVNDYKFKNTNDEVSSFGPERYIALSTGDNNNYDSLNTLQRIKPKQTPLIPVNEPTLELRFPNNNRPNPTSGLGTFDNPPMFE